MPEETGLIVLEKINPKEVLITGKGLDEVLAAIREKAFSMGQSVEEKEDRENIRSTANNIAKSKTFLVARANEIKAPHKKVIDEVNANVKKIKPTLDALKKEYRQPLTDWEDQKKIREAQEAKARQEKIDNRMSLLAGYLRPLPYQDVATMSDELFETTLSESKASWEQDQEMERIAEANRIAEEKQLEKERKEFEEKQKADQKERDRIMAEQQAELDKANAKIAAAQAEIEAKETELKAAQDAERAKVEAEAAEKERVTREAEEAEEKKRLKKEAAERAEALKPDKEKAIAWIESIRESLTPFGWNESDVTVKDSHIRNLMVGIMDEIKSALDQTHREIEEL